MSLVPGLGSGNETKHSHIWIRFIIALVIIIVTIAKCQTSASGPNKTHCRVHLFQSGGTCSVLLDPPPPPKIEN